MQFTAELIADLNNQIDAALADLHAATPNVRTRRVGRGNYTDILARAFGLVADGDVNATLSEIGGYVPNGYRHRAEADRLTVSVDLVEGCCSVTAVRSAAPSRAHGKGPQYVVRLARAGQSQGRCVSW